MLIHDIVMVRTNYRQPLFLVIIDIIPGHYLHEMSIRRYATLSWWEAVRRVSISEGVRLEETTMNPSRSRDALRSRVGVRGMTEVMGLEC